MFSFGVVERFGERNTAEERSFISNGVAVVFQRYIATLLGRTANVVYTWHLKDDPDTGGSNPCTRHNSFTTFQNGVLREKPWEKYL
ncbi:MAG: hypothetical protein WC613_01400 [Candidatus Aenigmatarchaeota archaeon]